MSSLTHRTLELRSIEYNRLIASRLNQEVIQKAHQRIDDLENRGILHPDYANQWRKLLASPLSKIRSELVADTESMRALRQNPIFVDLVTSEERWEIIRSIR